MDEVLTASPDDKPKLIGLRQNRAIRSPLMLAVAQTKQVAKVIAERDYEQAMALRGGSFAEFFRIFRTLMRAQPHTPDPQQRQLRLAVLHAGGPAPGMNTAVRVAVRLGIDKGHTMLGGVQRL